jgi:hypothetical protein
MGWIRAWRALEACCSHEAVVACRWGPRGLMQQQGGGQGACGVVGGREEGGGTCLGAGAGEQGGAARKGGRGGGEGGRGAGEGGQVGAPWRQPCGSGCCSCRWQRGGWVGGGGR